MPNLNAFDSDTLYATHGLQPYAAKCPPHLVRYGLRYYSKPGQTILDPMVGSGTSLIEARLMGRHSVGFDIDPLARLMARVKSRPVRDQDIERGYEIVMRRARQDMDALRASSASSAAHRRAIPPDFANRDYWFSGEVCEALAILSYHIAESAVSNVVRDFLWLAFASLILAKNSVANAQDVIHSRTHYRSHSTPPDVLSRFDARIHFMREKIGEFNRQCQTHPAVRVSARLGDARRLPLADETIDLVFTSPPYATALDYTRAHFLAVAWMEPALGVNLNDYRALGPGYIGSERGQLDRIPLDPLRSELAQSVVERLGRRSLRHARLIQHYFGDMERALSEMTRVLRDGRHAILVVCPSHIRKVTVPTHQVLVELGNAAGLTLKRQYTRKIYKHRRMLPYLQKAFGRRMSTEYVLIFQKT